MHAIACDSFAEAAYLAYGFEYSTSIKQRRRLERRTPLEYYEEMKSSAV